MDAVLLIVGPADVPDLDGEVVRLPADAGRAEIDPVLNRLQGRRLLVWASEAGLNRVVRRLLRRDLLATTPIGLLGPVRRAGDPIAGEPHPMGLIRDDHGGVLLTRA